MLVVLAIVFIVQNGIHTQRTTTSLLSVQLALPAWFVTLMHDSEPSQPASERWIGAQINLFGTGLTASRRTEKDAHNGGYCPVSGG